MELFAPRASDDPPSMPPSPRLRAVAASHRCDSHLTVRPAIRPSAPVTAGRAFLENGPTSDVPCRLTGTVGFRSSGPAAAEAAWARVSSDLITRLDSPVRPEPLHACAFRRLRFTIQDAFHRLSMLRALAPQPSSLRASHGYRFACDSRTLLPSVLSTIASAIATSFGLAHVHRLVLRLTRAS